MPPDAAKIAAEWDDWNGPRQPEEDIFGSGDPEHIAALVDAFCTAQLGAPIHRYEFFASGVFSVHGVRLADGRRVVIKAARPSVRSAFLVAVQTVQSHLANYGFPCPRPVLGPSALGHGVAVAEEMLLRGGPADAHDPTIRRAMAFALARQVELARPFVALDGLGPSLLDSAGVDELWPEPHDARFDFAATSRGAEWIDELALAARQRLLDPAGELVVAHSDWRAEHARFQAARIVASHDWQSLAVGYEPVLLGQVGHHFTADFSIEQGRSTPTLAEFRAFISDYQAARRRPFSQAEHTMVDAAWVYATAYTARCEHSDRVLGMPWATGEITDDSHHSLLARHGRQLLA